MHPEWLRRSNCMFNSAEESLATGNDQIGGCSICCRLSRGSTIVVKNRDEHRATLSLVSLPSRLGDQCHPCRAPILACPRPTLYLFPICDLPSIYSPSIAISATIYPTLSGTLRTFYSDVYHSQREDERPLQLVQYKAQQRQ